MKIMVANIPTCIRLPDGYERYFIKAGSRWPFSTIKRREVGTDYIPFPFYLAYASAILKEGGYNVYAIDCIAANLSEDQFMERFRHVRPDIILVESQTPTIKYDLQMLAKLKSINAALKIMLAGPHPSVMFETLLLENPFIDVILLREYEFTCLDVVRSGFDPNKLETVKGVAFRVSQSVISTEAEPLDVNRLPFPDRDSFPVPEQPDPTQYHDFEQFKPAVQMHASRGCPFKCNFCLWNQVMYVGGPYRPFRPEKVANEVEHCIDKYGVKEVYFDDDTFTGNKQHVLDVCSEFRKRKLRVKWSCMGDAMVTDGEMLDAMSRAHCVGIKFGVESADQTILSKINKPIDFQRVHGFVEHCVRLRIKTHATFTFGIMGESRSSMEKTLEYAKYLDADSVQFSITIPFPGTRYFDCMKKEGRILSENWDDYDGSRESVVDFGSLSNQEVVQFCSRAYGLWLEHKRRDHAWRFRQRYYRARSFLNRTSLHVKQVKQHMNR